MDAAAAAIAFVQAASVCIKLSKGLIHKYRAFKNANDSIANLVLQIEGIWYKTETQIKFLERIVHTLDDRFIDLQNACLDRLTQQLRHAMVDMEALTGTDLESVSFPLSLNVKPLKKVQYALFEKRLRKNIQDLQAWHREFDPSWFLIGRITSPAIDTALNEHAILTVPQSGLEVIRAIREAINLTRARQTSNAPVFHDVGILSPTVVPLPNSNMALGDLKGNSLPVLLDMTTFDRDVDKVKYAPRIRDLARLLSLSDPETLGLLQCLGVIKHFEPGGDLSQFQFVYKIPPSLTYPSTLRSRLTSAPISLDARIRMAKSLARGVMAVHSADLVHKNVRPETIVVFEDSSELLPVAFLVGFERFRPFNAATNLTGDMVWTRNIYRFPNRQGIRPEDVYIMQHDIYSLGVCLLEIGIWTSFITTTDPPRPGPSLDISRQLGMKEHVQAAWEIKKIFIDMATELLPSAMGLAYTEVTISCLTCLDQGAANLFADARDLYDEDEILVGVAFIEKILMRLESIRL